VKCRMQASAITASCDRLKKCLTQATESYFNASDVVQRVLLKQEWPENSFSHW